MKVVFVVPRLLRVWILMKLNYKVFLTSLIIASICIVSGLLLFGTMGASLVVSDECDPDRIPF